MLSVASYTKNVCEYIKQQRNCDIEILLTGGFLISLNIPWLQTLIAYYQYVSLDKWMLHKDRSSKYMAFPHHVEYV